MNTSELEDLIRRSLDDFYQRRMKQLTELKLSNVLRKKNPYLLRAVGIRKASEIVAAILRVYMSSPDENIFDDAFFESISGQAFWEELTGDLDFYIKLINLMRDYPTGYDPTNR